jgi:hypothetical protein
MFDGDLRLVLFNRKYMSILDGDPRVIKPGATLRQIFEHRIAQGHFPGLTVDQLLAAWRADIAHGRPTSYIQDFSDGRTIGISISPMPNGGWVGTVARVPQSNRHRRSHGRR